MKQVSHNLPKNSPNIIDEYLQKTKAAYEDPEIVNSYWERTKNILRSNNLDKMVQLLWPQAKVLDVGCGPGRDSAYLVSKGLDVTGIDYSTQMIAKAKELHGENDCLVFKTMDMMDFTFPDEEFDGVWASASLLHIPKKHIPSVLKGICRILKPKGILLVSVMQGSGEKYTVETKYAKPVERFFSFFGSSEIQKYIESAGFIPFEMNSNPSYSRQSTIWLNIFSRKVSSSHIMEDRRKV